MIRQEKHAKYDVINLINIHDNFTYYKKHTNRN